MHRIKGGGAKLTEIFRRDYASIEAFKFHHVVWYRFAFFDMLSSNQRLDQEFFYPVRFLGNVETID